MKELREIKDDLSPNHPEQRLTLHEHIKSSNYSIYPLFSLSVMLGFAGSTLQQVTQLADRYLTIIYDGAIKVQ
jgi:hypothetical protein